MAHKATPTQTVGPYYSLGLMPEVDNILARPGTPGEAIRLEGAVFDGDGDPLLNVLVEIWQANADGRYAHPLDLWPLPPDPTFIGFGRASTGNSGQYWFETIKPGPVPRMDGGGFLAPHIMVLVHASGVAYPLVTLCYFEDAPPSESDPLIKRVPEERRSTLIARREEGDGVPVYRYDIVLRGQAEDLVLESKVAAESAGDLQKAVGKAETVFLAVQ